MIKTFLCLQLFLLIWGFCPVLVWGETVPDRFESSILPLLLNLCDNDEQRLEILWRAAGQYERLGNRKLADKYYKQLGKVLDTLEETDRRHAIRELSLEDNMASPYSYNLTSGQYQWLIEKIAAIQDGMGLNGLYANALQKALDARNYQAVVDWWKKQRTVSESESEIRSIVAQASLKLGDIELAEEVAMGIEEVESRFLIWTQAVHDLLEQEEPEKAKRALIAAEQCASERSADNVAAWERIQRLSPLILAWHALGDKQKLESGMSYLKLLLDEIGWEGTFDNMAAHGMAYEMYCRLEMHQDADHEFNSMLSVVSLSDPQQWEESRMDLGVKLWAVRLSRFKEWQRIEQLIESESVGKKDLHHAFLIYFVTAAAIDADRKDIAEKWIQYKLNWAEAFDIDSVDIERDVLIGDVIVAMKKMNRHEETLPLIIQRISSEEYRIPMVIEAVLEGWENGGFGDETQLKQLQQLLQIL